jgi:ferredoxin-NADP reductase
MTAEAAFPSVIAQETADAYPLRVAAVAQEADSVISLTLRHPEGRGLATSGTTVHVLNQGAAETL